VESNIYCLIEEKLNMAGRLIVNAAIGAEDWTSEIESKNLLKKGFYNLEFTNMDNTSQPAIAAGSSIDIDGVLYKFDTEEAITGSPSDGTAYVKIVSGATATAEFTNTALPDYDHDKLGYYDGSSRYVLSVIKDSSSWTNKSLLTPNFPILQTKVIPIGSWNMTASAWVSLPHGLDWTKIRNVNITIVSDDGASMTDIDFPATLTGLVGVEDNTGMWQLSSTEIGVIANSISANCWFFLKSQDAGIYYTSTAVNRGWITIQYEG